MYNGVMHVYMYTMYTTVTVIYYVCRVMPTLSDMSVLLSTKLCMYTCTCMYIHTAQLAEAQQTHVHKHMYTLYM